MHPNVHHNTIYSSQDMEANYMSINRGMSKDDALHIQTHRILLSHKKEWNNTICSNMDGPRDYHTKWSKLEEHKYETISMWKLIKMIQKELIYQTNTYFEIKLMVTKGENVGEGRDKLGGWD